MLSRPNVVYITVGDRRVEGRRTGELSLVAYVTRKGGATGEDLIPLAFDVQMPDGSTLTLPTDVVELPATPQALGMRAGHVIRAADGDIGMCGLTFSKDNRSYIATNAHVVANLRLGFPGEPAVQDPATMHFKQIGRRIYISDPANLPMEEDLAIVEARFVEVDRHAVVGESRPIAGFSNFVGTSNSRFWYTVNGVKILCSDPQPTVADIPVPILVDGATFPYANFWRLQVDQGMVAPGHSGSLICTGTGRSIVACGMLFGGEPPSYVYAFPIDDVMRRIAAHLP